MGVEGGAGGRAQHLLIFTRPPAKPFDVRHPYLVVLLGKTRFRLQESTHDPQGNVFGSSPLVGDTCPKV
jgi:hypothetical protein